MLKAIGNGAAVLPVRENVKVPVLLPGSIAIGSLATILTTGSPSTSLSRIVTLAFDAEPSFAPGALVSVATTVSPISTIPSSTGSTAISTKLLPTGIVTELLIV